MRTSETIADLLQTIPGPIVLVGHSCGGMVISNAATGNPNVKALVYINVNAFIPDEGESALGLDSTQPGSVLGAGPPNTVFNFVPFPGAAPGDALLYVKPSVFRKGFANDLPAKEGALLEATQAPAVFSALKAPSGPPAWKTSRRSFSKRQRAWPGRRPLPPHSVYGDAHPAGCRRRKA